MIKTKTEILEAIKNQMGENLSDDNIHLIEDITDTFGDFEEKTKDQTDWKNKYEENDKEWRERYTSRFFDSTQEPDTLGKAPEDKPDPSTEITFDDLFK